MSKKQKQEQRRIAQVSSKSLIPPEEPDEVTEADVDFSKEEEAIAAKIKALKAQQTALKKRKAQAVGGKKLTRMRKYAKETAEWASKAASKFVTSTERANTALGNLQDYEEKLGVKAEKQVSQQLIESNRLGLLTEAAEVLSQS